MNKTYSFSFQQLVRCLAATFLLGFTTAMLIAVLLFPSSATAAYHQRPVFKKVWNWGTCTELVVVGSGDPIGGPADLASLVCTQSHWTWEWNHGQPSVR